MLKAVLFDLDGTLLDINLNAFIGGYGSDTAKLISEIGNVPQTTAALALVRIAQELHKDPETAYTSETGLDIARRILFQETGVPIDDEVIAEVFATYAQYDVERLKKDAAPTPGAHAALEVAVNHGLRLALSTNPIFPQAIIQKRMEWARIEEYPFEIVTSLENTYSRKPHASYYLDIIEEMELQPDEVIIVGNDPRADFTDPYVGIETFYVGRMPTFKNCTWSGNMVEFARVLQELVETGY